MCVCVCVCVCTYIYVYMYAYTIDFAILASKHRIQWHSSGYLVLDTLYNINTIRFPAEAVSSCLRNESWHTAHVGNKQNSGHLGTALDDDDPE